MKRLHRLVAPGALLFITSFGFAQSHAPALEVGEMREAANGSDNMHVGAWQHGGQPSPTQVSGSESASQPQQQVTTSYQQVEAELARVNQAIAQADASLEQFRRERAMIHKRMVLRGRAYYRLSQAGLLPIGGGFDALLDHTSKLDRLRQGLGRDARAAKSLEQKSAQMLQTRVQLVAKQQPLQLQREAMARAHVALMQTQDRQMAFERAFSRVGPGLGDGGDYTAVYGAGSDPGQTSGSGVGSHILMREVKGFEAMMGRLSFPVAGRTEVRVVRRMGAGGPGLELLAPSGGQVLSVYQGRVAFADEYGTYGKVVIIDHGNQYFSVYGELGEVQVKVGQDVGARGPVGLVGVKASGQGSLYFELRQGSDTIDPAPWFGL